MMHPRALSLSVLVLAASLAAASPPNSGGYRGPQRNGIYPAEGLARTWPDDGPPLLWTYRGLGEGWATATVVGDTVYCLGGAPGRLSALDLADGSLRWSAPYGPEFTARFNGSRATPSVVGDRVVFSSGKKDERSVYCLDAHTGETLWHVDGNARFGGASQGWGYNESPLVFSNTVICTLRAKDATTPPLVALDLATGETVWTADPGPGDLSAGDCSVSLAGEPGQQVLIATFWRELRAVDPADGRTVWSVPMKKGSIITPVYNDGLLFVGKNAVGTMLRVGRDGRSHEELWRHGINGISQAVIVQGKLLAIGRAPNWRSTTSAPTASPRPCGKNSVVQGERSPRV